MITRNSRSSMSNFCGAEIRPFQWVTIALRTPKLMYFWKIFKIEQPHGSFWRVICYARSKWWWKCTWAYSFISFCNELYHSHQFPSAKLFLWSVAQWYPYLAEFADELLVKGCKVRIRLQVSEHHQSSWAHDGWSLVRLHTEWIGIIGLFEITDCWRSKLDLSSSTMNAELVNVFMHFWRQMLGLRFNNRIGQYVIVKASGKVINVVPYIVFIVKSAQCESVWKPQANLPDTPVAPTSASKYFQMLPDPPGALQSALSRSWMHLQLWGAHSGRYKIWLLG